MGFRVEVGIVANNAKEAFYPNAMPKANHLCR
jgi:hypothetical protein